MNAPIESAPPADLKQNPLVNYLKIFQNQHKVISVLYKGLIVSFSGFILLLSFLIITVFDSQLIPLWGKIALGVIDLMLILGVAKAFYELSRYKRKSVSVLNQVYNYLNADLAKFEKIKSEHEAIAQSHKKLQNKILSISSKAKKHGIEDYKGWDCQVCPNCHTSLEMLVEVCPQCHHNLAKTFTN
ncbi:MAG: hypothetical protein MJE63_21165 [Proteobacteria bacterium]|nr:hypothetical protein [Pseudomonadota bacterium]